MDTRNKFLAVMGLLFVVPWLSGCGAAGDPASVSSGSGGGSGSSGVAVTGSVEAPVSTSTSISVGASASKSVGKGSNDSNADQTIIVSKASTDIPVTGGTVTATLPGGTKLDDGQISSSGAITGVVIDPSSLDSTKQVLLKCNVAGKKFTSLVDLTSNTAGSTADAGKVNSDSTLATQQVYYQADPNCSPDSPSAVCAAKFLSGEVKPLALYKTFKGEFGVSSSAGSSDAASAYQTMSKAFRAAMANGTPSFSDINSALAGGGILNTWKSFDSSLSGVDMSAAIGHIQNYMPAVSKTFADSTTFTKYQQAGDTGWAAAAQYFGRQTGSNLLNGVNQPAIFQGYLQQNATAFNSGDKTAFDAMKKTGAVMGELAGKCGASDFNSAKFAALQTMFNATASSFDTLASSKIASFGEAMCNEMKAAGNATQLALLTNNPSVFMGKIFDNPGAYTGAGGPTIFQNQYATFVQNPTVFAGTTSKGCAADADCGSGFICNIGAGYCVSSTCTGNCAFGAPCKTNGICQSNSCTACTPLGSCTGSGFCTGAAGVDPTAGVLKAAGSSCTLGGECYSQTCSSGACAASIPTGSASFTGFYKRNSGGTCITNISIEGPSGGTFINFGPDNGGNGSTNTFMGGGVTFSGTSSPFSINNSNGVGAVAAVSNAQSVTLKCDGTSGSTTLALSSGTLTGTCAMSGGLSGTCTVNHTKQ